MEARSSMIRRVLILLVVGVLGLWMGSVANPESYTRGFLDAFTSASRECRAHILHNYARSIFQEMSK